MPNSNIKNKFKKLLKQKTISPIPPCEILHNIFEKKIIFDHNNKEVSLHSNIPREFSFAIYNFIKKEKPSLVIEIGMAFGVSTLSILTALKENGKGRLISIDPFQNDSMWKGLGLLNVKRAGFSHLHTLVEELDYLALPKFITEGHKVDFAYIDGWHTFDYALLDFFYLDKLLNENGVVTFNDCGWRSVHKVLKFLRTHRSYKEIEVGLSKNYHGTSYFDSFIRFMQGRSNSDRYFRKLKNWEPNWDHFKKF